MLSDLHTPTQEAESQPPTETGGEEVVRKPGDVVLETPQKQKNKEEEVAKTDVADVKEGDGAAMDESTPTKPGSGDKRKADQADIVPSNEDSKKPDTSEA